MENTNRHPQEISAIFANITNEKQTELESALYNLKAITENHYNDECYTALYNALSIIADKIEKATQDAEFYTNNAEKYKGKAGTEYIEGKAAAFWEIITPPEN
jgi:hypothetical protein